MSLSQLAAILLGIFFRIKKCFSTMTWYVRSVNFIYDKFHILFKIVKYMYWDTFNELTNRLKCLLPDLYLGITLVVLAIQLINVSEDIF